MDNFIASSTFQGSRPGLVYKRGDDGRLGYWPDSATSNDQQASRKRARADMEAQIGLDNEENVLALDATVVNAMLYKLETFVLKNESDRLKYEGKPEQYVDSEVELHACIQELHSVAANPELLSVVTSHAQGKSFEHLTNLLYHTNASIVASVLGLMYEITDVNANSPSEDARYITTFCVFSSRTWSSRFNSRLVRSGNFRMESRRVFVCCRTLI